MMSFLGSMDNLMKGSGIEELFAETHAANSVVHMMSGKAVSRALRAHLLTGSALTTLLIEILTERGNGVVADFEVMFTHVFEGKK